jgi:hypothetical protein
MPMFRKTQEGSVFILLIGILMILTLCSTVSMRIATYLHDIALVRVKSLQQRYATEALLLFGIAYLKEQKDTIDAHVSMQNPYCIYRGPWIPGEEVLYHSIINISRKEGAYIITASLYQEDALVETQEAEVFSSALALSANAVTIAV